MLLRTYPLITHPAYLRATERPAPQLTFLRDLAPVDVPIHLPELESVYRIGNFLGVSPLVIRSIINNTEKHYNRFTLRKFDGRERIIAAPRTFLKVVQWWILDVILETRSDLPNVYGFSKGKSFIDNARQHVGANHLLNMDVRDFFPSLSSNLVVSAFSDFGYRSAVCEGLAKLCTLDNALPQGAPSSPKLSNILFYSCDIALQNLAVNNGLKYTRYADDITFSSDSRIGCDIVGRVSEIIAKIGLSLNPRKTRYMGVNQQKEVTGLILAKDGVALSRDRLNGMRGWFHRVEQNPMLYVNKYDNLKGSVNLLKQIGGRGTPKLILAGESAIRAVKQFLPPRLSWSSSE